MSKNATSRIELPLWTAAMTHKDWIEAFTEYYDHYEKGDVLDKEEAPDSDGEAVYWPVVGTKEAFLARVCQHPQRVALTAAAGFSVNATQAKNIKAEEVDEEVLEQYARAVKKQHDKVDQDARKAAAWPKAMKAAVADIKLSIKGNPNVKGTVAQLVVMCDRLPWVSGKLPLTFGKR